jgi:hypothetical protein
MGRAGVLQPFAVGRYGMLLGARGAHSVVLVCAKGKKAPAVLARQSWCSLRVVALAPIAAGGK